MCKLIRILRSKKNKRQRALSEGGFFVYYKKSQYGKLYRWKWIKQFGRKKYKLFRGNPRGAYKWCL